jgi:hypothetical protein
MSCDSFAFSYSIISCSRDVGVGLRHKGFYECKLLLLSRFQQRLPRFAFATRGLTIH